MRKGVEKLINYLVRGLIHFLCPGKVKLPALCIMFDAMPFESVMNIRR
jgi:hypothetical protein